MNRQKLVAITFQYAVIASIVVTAVLMFGGGGFARK